MSTSPSNKASLARHLTSTRDKVMIQSVSQLTMTHSTIECFAG